MSQTSYTEDKVKVLRLNLTPFNQPRGLREIPLPL